MSRREKIAAIVEWIADASFPSDPSARTVDGAKVRALAASRPNFARRVRAALEAEVSPVMADYSYYPLRPKTAALIAAC